MEISMPNGDSLRSLGLCWSSNPIDVIIRNSTDSTIHFYENWNSYGYYNFSFEIETDDSLYLITKTHRLWWRNFPSSISIPPNQSMVFHFNLTDSTCVNRSQQKYTWKGLPNKEYEFAILRVKYHLPLKHLFYDRRDYSHSDYREFTDEEITYSESKEKDSSSANKIRTYIFHKDIVSSPVKIRIQK